MSTPSEPQFLAADTSNDRRDTARSRPVAQQNAAVRRGGPYRIALVSGGTSDPSSTRMLADRIADQVARQAHERGAEVAISVIDLRQLASEITTAMVSQLIGPGLERAIEVMGAADGIIAAAPVYMAQPSGLFSSFFHTLDNDLLIGKPVVLAATAGTARHALVVDGEMRSLFAFLRTLTAPTSVFAASDDWNSTELGLRIGRAAFELLLLMESGFAGAIRAGSWQRYQHEYGSAGDGGLDIAIDTDLMRLAAGGTA